MADDTCYELDCCPLGDDVPAIGGVLSLAGDDSTNSDPNIADGQLLNLQEGFQTTASMTNGSSIITVASSSGIISGQSVYVLGINKTITTITDNSPVLVLADVTGLTGGQNVNAEGVEGSATISSIVGLNVTMDQNSTFDGTNVPALFYPVSTGLGSATVVSVVGNSVTMSTNATATLSNVLIQFYPATVDPNLVDGEDIYT